MIDPLSPHIKKMNLIFRFTLFGLLLILLAGCASQPSGLPMHYRWASIEGGQIQESQAGEQFDFSIPVDEGMIAEGVPVSIKVSGVVNGGWLRFELRAPDGEPVWNSGVINPGDFSISTKYPLPAGRVGEYALGLVYGANTDATYNLGWRAFRLGPLVLLPGLGIVAVGLKGSGFRRVGLILVLVLLVATPFVLFPPHRPLPATGPHGVATARDTYTDMRRLDPFSGRGEERRVNVAFWYPQVVSRGETFPLVVFSHGGLGTETSNESLFLELASHGYVVASIGHPYHALWTRGEDGHTTLVSWEYFGELQREDAKADRQQSYRYYQKWMATRTGDINVVIDTILAKAAGGAGGVYALVDGARIGVMGHSLGGSAALAMPRQRDDIDAVIALEAPFLYDISGVEGGEFAWLDAAYPAPVLNIYSDSSWSHLAEWPQYARNHELLSSASPTAVSLYLAGAGHFSLTDLALASPLLTRLLEGGPPTLDREEYLRAVSQACLEFFDRYLDTYLEM